MAIAADGGRRGALIASRTAVSVAAVVLIATGAWFATSWIDVESDSTCGAVVHPDVWLERTSLRAAGTSWSSAPRSRPGFSPSPGRS